MSQTQIKGHDIESTSLENKISTDIDFEKIETDRVNLVSVNPSDTATFFGTDNNGDSILHIRIGNGSGDMIRFESYNGSSSTSLMEIGQSTVTIKGDLVVSGTTTTINSETLEVADNYIILNSGMTGSPTLDAGIKVERGSESDAEFKWNETEDKWETTNLKVTDSLYIGAEKVTAVPIGTILMYDGTGIADVASRSEDIGDRAGDTISLPGWKVCNGNGGTPNLINRFIRGENASGNTGGDDDAVLINHRHEWKIRLLDNLYTATGPCAALSRSASSPVAGAYKYSTNSWAGGYATSDTVTDHVVDAGYTDGESTAYQSDGDTSEPVLINTGERGIGKNMPAYYSVIFIKRVS